MRFASKCPSCGAALRMPDKLEATEVTCPKCKARFVATRDVDSTGAEPPPIPQDETQGLLDTLESFLKRMIAGLFRFAFVRLPCLLYDILVWLFPSFIKVSNRSPLGGLTLRVPGVLS